jgi:hypothetical protein
MDTTEQLDELKRRWQSVWDVCEMGYIVDGTKIQECGQCGGKGRSGAVRHDPDCAQFLMELLDRSIDTAAAMVADLRAKLRKLATSAEARTDTSAR